MVHHNRHDTNTSNHALRHVFTAEKLGANQPDGISSALAFKSRDLCSTHFARVRRLA